MVFQCYVIVLPYNPTGFSVHGFPVRWGPQCLAFLHVYVCPVCVSVGRVRAALNLELHTWTTFLSNLPIFCRPAFNLKEVLLYFCKKKEISLLNNIGLLLHSTSYIAHDVKYKTFS